MSILPYVFGGFLCVVGTGLAAGGVKALRKAKAAATWPTIAGKLLSAEIVVHRSSGLGAHGNVKRSSYEPVVKYSYSVGGRDYRSKRIGFVDLSGSKVSAERRIDSLRAKGELIVHYDPADPGKAVLDPGATGSGGLLGIGGALVLLGVLALLNAKTLSELFSF